VVGVPPTMKRIKNKQSLNLAKPNMRHQGLHPKHQLGLPRRRRGANLQWKKLKYIINFPHLTSPHLTSPYFTTPHLTSLHHTSVNPYLTRDIKEGSTWRVAGA
jgi:hypothetical protein